MSTGLEFIADLCARNGWRGVSSVSDLEAIAQVGGVEVGPEYREAIESAVAQLRLGDVVTADSHLRLAQDLADAAATCALPARRWAA